MTIQGTVQTSRTNNYGYTSYKVDGTWYGADARGSAKAAEGDKVQFDAYNKPGKDGKEWPTLILATLKVQPRVAPAYAPQVQAGTPAPALQAKSASSGLTGWDAKDVRINRTGARNSAIEFLALAQSVGALTSVAKAKPAAQYDILKALLDELTDAFAADSYHAEVPKKAATVAPGPAEVSDDLDAPATEDEKWS